MSSATNRLDIHRAGDYYLSPLNAKQCVPQLFNRYLEQIPGPIDQLPGIDPHHPGQVQRARYYEVEHEMEVEGVSWSERRIMCYSLAYAKSQADSFRERLKLAEQQIKALVVSKKGRRNPKTLPDLHGRIAALEKKHKVEGCYKITTAQVIDHYTIQRHKARPARTEQRITLQLTIEANEDFIEAQIARKGWQMYGTNAPTDKISAVDLIVHYRNEYRIEHLFDYAINRDTGLLPLYLKKEKTDQGINPLIDGSHAFFLYCPVGCP